MRGLIGETWRLLRTHGPAMVLVALVLLVPAELAVAYAAEDSESLGVAASAGLASFVTALVTVLGAVVIVFLLAFVTGLPILLLTELTDPIWVDGLGNALFGVVLNLPTAALAYAIYRQARAV